MSDETKLQPGQKRCPKCEGVINGPRTRTCPHCGVDTMEGRPVKVKTAKNVPVVTSTLPDPYTKVELAYNDSDEHIVVVRRPLEGYFKVNKAFNRVKEYLGEVTIPSDVVFENSTTFA